MRLISFIPSILIGYFTWTKIGCYEQENLHQIVSVFASISSTMLGFIIAALSILTALSGERLIGNMVKTGHYQILLGHFAQTSVAYFVLTVTTLVCMFLSLPFLLYGVSVMVAVAMFCLFLSIDVGRKFWLVLNNL